MSTLWQDLKNDMDALDSAVDEARESGIKFAVAEAKYQAAKAKKALEMKADKVPVTLIETVIKGMPEVNTLLMERLSAEAIYKVSQEHIMSLKLQIKVNNDQYQREWNQAGRTQ